MPLFSDSDALHMGSAGEIVGLTEKVTPASADVVIIEDSAASNVKKKVQVGNLSSGSSNVFGQNYQSASSEGTSTTTNSTMQDKVTLTTTALTGTYRVSFYCEVTPEKANKREQCRLYNVTDAVELCWDEYRPVLGRLFKATAGFSDVTFTGAAKTFKIQFASQDGSTTVNIRRARIEIWRET